MKASFWAAGGMALGAVYVALTGIIGVQAVGARAGAVFNLNNEVVGITSPSTPVLQMVATALLAGLVFYAASVRIRTLPALARSSALAGFLVATISLIIWSVTIKPLNAAEGIPDVGIALGWDGWIQQGGTNPAVHLLAVLTLGTLWRFTSNSSAEERSHTE